MHSINPSLPVYLQQQAYQYRLSKTSKLPDSVDWIQKHFYIPELNAPIQLVPYQKAVIREGLKKDANGLFEYSFILWSDIKKSAKSTIAGAMSLYLAWFHAWETVRIVGNDLKQADSRTFYYIERAIRLNPQLVNQCRIKTYHIELPNNTSISAIPVDPKGEAGGGDLVTTFTEMWAMKNKASQTLWTETTLSPLKFGKSIRIGESYAGLRGESPILEPLYDVGVKHGERLDLSFEDETGYHDLSDLEVYRNGRMLTLWNTQPRCPWQTPEYYQQEAMVLPPSEMDRIHGNKWGSAKNAFVNEIWWNACKSELEPLKDGQPIIVALDAAISGDCFGLVGVSRKGDKVQPRFVHKWTPQPGQPIIFSNLQNPNDPSTPEGVLRQICKTNNVIEICYDPTQLHEFATRQFQAGVGFFKPFQQGVDRAIADKQLYDLIIQKRLEHDGNPELTEHVLNAGATKEDKYLRIVKMEDKRKIDLCVCLSMASDRILYYNI